MANIGFTDKQLHVYDRFNALRLAYQAKHGRTYAPGFLTKLMDAWEYSENVEYDSIIQAYIDLPSAPKEADTQPVIIKQSDGALYLQSSSVATANFGMTHHKQEAMVFDSHDQAKAFLRQAGREVGDWILEPVNQ